MFTKFIEAMNEEFNWGKFMVARFTPEEWSRKTDIDTYKVSLLGGRGWTPNHIFVMDLQTGEGAMFLPGGSPVADLNKHKIWVCPLFEPFLRWLYAQDLQDLTLLPSVVSFTNEEAPPSMVGYRREGRFGGKM